MVQPPSKTNLDPLLRAYALFLSSTCFFLHILKWCPIEWCVNLEIRPFLLMCFCPNRLKVPTGNARGWAVEFNFFCFIGGLKWYFASSAVERMVQPPSKTNLDPLLRAYALLWALHVFSCIFWNDVQLNGVWILKYVPFCQCVFVPTGWKSQQKMPGVLSCGIQFFLFHWGSEMVFCIISCWKNGSTSK